MEQHVLIILIALILVRKLNWLDSNFTRSVVVGCWVRETLRTRWYVVMMVMLLPPQTTAVKEQSADTNTNTTTTTNTTVDNRNSSRRARACLIYRGPQSNLEECFWYFYIWDNFIDLLYYKIGVVVTIMMTIIRNKIRMTHVPTTPLGKKRVQQNACYKQMLWDMCVEDGIISCLAPLFLTWMNVFGY